jgi:hypothetical protein
MDLTPPGSPHYLWSVHVLGLAYYRAGLNDKAIECLKKCVDDLPNWKPNAGNMLVLAMAHHRLKQDVEARHWLDRAGQLAPPNTGPELEQPNDFLPLGREWLEWLGLQMLHREANDLLRAGRADPAGGR